MHLTIERVSAFNGLDVLVARDEGLFAAEGLDLRIAVPAPEEMRSSADGTLSNPRGSLSPFGAVRNVARASRIDRISVRLDSIAARCNSMSSVFAARIVGAALSRACSMSRLINRGTAPLPFCAASIARMSSASMGR